MFSMMKFAISGTHSQHLRSSREHLKNWGRTSCVCSPRTRWVRPHNRGSLRHLPIHLALKSHLLVQGEGRTWRGFGKTTSSCKSGVLKSNVRLEKWWMTLIVNDLVLLKAQVLQPITISYGIFMSIMILVNSKVSSMWASGWSTINGGQGRNSSIYLIGIGNKFNTKSKRKP